MRHQALQTELQWSAYNRTTVLTWKDSLLFSYQPTQEGTMEKVPVGQRRTDHLGKFMRKSWGRKEVGKGEKGKQ